MGLNVMFNDFDYNLMPKQEEIFKNYSKIIQWGRANPVSFIEKFMNIQFTDMQRWVFLNTWKSQVSCLVMGRNSGKALSLDTKVWTLIDNKLTSKTVGELKAGDYIFDAQGKLSEVIHLNPVIFDEYYEVEFSDGEKIKCNGEHLWLVHDKNFNKILLCAAEIYNHYNNIINYDEKLCVQVHKELDFVGIKSKEEYGFKSIVGVKKFKEKIPMRCITMRNDDGLFLCGENMTVTHNSFLSAPYIMAKTLLYPNFHAYIMAPSGGQSSETFMKLENLAKNNIASLIGVSSFFLENCIAPNAKQSPFVHDKGGYHVQLFNGSTVESLNSVAKNIVGIRSNLNKRKCSRSR